MKAFFNYISWLFLGRPVKQKLRTGALQSLKLYIKFVGGARKASMMAVLGIIGLASITIGFFMLIGGLLWFANLNPEAYPWIMVIAGALFTLIGVIGFAFAFREKLWVDLSHINDLTAAALAKLPDEERPDNPAVVKAWELATAARRKENLRIEQELQAQSLKTAREEAVVASAASAQTFSPTTLQPAT